MTNGRETGLGHVLVRADASHLMGAGHIMRCLALADRLSAEGAEICFVSASIPLSLSARIARAGHRLFRLEASDLPDRQAGWDGSVRSADEQLADAEATRAALGGWIPAWVIVDHYQLDAHWETAAQSRMGGRLLVLDDLANRPHLCDVLVDQTIGRIPADYSGLVPADCHLLTGSLYALLRPEFARARPTALARRREALPVSRLLVSLGATDLDGVTARAVRSILRAGLDCHIDVVLGPDAPSLPEMERLAAENVHVHVDRPDMAGLMAAADLAVGAAGGSTWERCCLGLPTVTVALADNQRLIAGRLEQLGATTAVASIDDIGTVVADLAQDGAARMAMTAAAAAVTDGQGAGRVADLLRNCGARPSSPIEPAELAFRAAESGDAELLWLWRNDPVTRAMSVIRDPVPWTDHVAWFDRALVSDRTSLFVAEAGGTPVGVIRFDRLDGDDPGFEVSINIRPDGRGGGAGATVLAAGCSYFLDNVGPARLEARISDSNPASRRIFERLGFERLQSLGGGDFGRYVRPEGAS